jgi:hypothetical protein
VFFRDPEDVLVAWQESHGHLDAKWKQSFLKHPTMKEILSNLDEHIAVAIRRNKKLIDIVEDLRNQELKLAEFTRNIHPHSTNIERGGGIAGRIEDTTRSKIESREKESGRWGRTYS